MRRKPVIWKKLALLLVSSLLSLVVMELFVRAFLTVRNVGPAFTVYDPDYGKALKKNFTATRYTPEFKMRITLNSHGFRGPEPEPMNPRRILLLGDSFTMGYGVDDGEEYPALVRAALEKSSPGDFSVINTGMGSNGNGRWIKFLREEADRYGPELVVLQFCSNDFLDNTNERLFERSEAGELIELPVPAPGMRRRLQIAVEGVPGLAYSYLVGLTRQVSWPARAPSVEFEAARFIRENRLLIGLSEEALAICQGHGWPVLVILVAFEGERLDKMRQFCSARNIPTLVIPIQRERPEFYYKRDGHWNATGHQFVAQQVLEALKPFGIGDRKPD
ncbi:MAG: SGNH/GDSL hydrolase family protein [Planctomycetota bacterium]|jgi:lysophospholipase L1-like esterase